MSQPAMRNDDMIKQTYAGVTQIGKGGVGTVFKGKNVLMKEEHAIKIQDLKKAKPREIEMLVETENSIELTSRALSVH